MTKNEYLHELGLRLLLRNCASIPEMTDTLMDYSGLLPEQEISEETIKKLGTPKSAARELKDGYAGRRAFFVAAAALLAAAGLRWAVLLFEGYWRPAGGSAAVFACGAVRILWALMLVAARVTAQSLLLPLRNPKRRERAALWIFCLLPLAASAAVFAACNAALTNAANVSAEEMLRVGPRITALISIFSWGCVTFMGYSLYKAFSGSTNWSAVFAISAGASGTLRCVKQALSTLTETETALRILLPCAIPCALGLLLAAVSAALIAHGKAEGEKLWTLK